MEPVKENPILTDTEREQLREYLARMEELAAREPEYSAFDGEVQEAWEEWNKEAAALNSQYGDIVLKALASSYESWSKTNPRRVSAILSTLFYDDGEPLNSIGAHRITTVNYPLDKPNSVIWSMLKENTHGQLTFPIKAEPTASKQKINIIYSIDFDGIEANGLSITKKLTQFDKRVYIAVGALWNAGNSVITVSQIYRAMGYRTDTPGKTDREKIDKSLTKMRGAMITLNNRQEIEAGYKYPEFVYDGALLPFERIRKQDVINGQLVEASIHPFREPPLISFARGREQITSIPPKLLQSPVSKTETNLAIEDYLIERISHAKTGRQPKKILLSTIYKKANITTAKQRSRTPEKIRKYLDYYKECGYIKGYTLDKTSITLQL